MLNIPTVRFEKSTTYLNNQLQTQNNNKQLVLDIITNIGLLRNADSSVENADSILDSANDFLKTFSGNITTIEQLKIEITNITKELTDLLSYVNTSRKTKEFYIAAFSNLKNNIVKYTENFQLVQKLLERDNNKFNEFINENNFKYTFNNVSNSDSNIYEFAGFSVNNENTLKNPSSTIESSDNISDDDLLESILLDSIDDDIVDNDVSSISLNKKLENADNSSNIDDNIFESILLGTYENTNDSSNTKKTSKTNKSDESINTDAIDNSSADSSSEGNISDEEILNNMDDNFIESLLLGSDFDVSNEAITEAPNSNDDENFNDSIDLSKESDDIIEVSNNEDSKIQEISSTEINDSLIESKKQELEINEDEKTEDRNHEEQKLDFPIKSYSYEELQEELANIFDEINGFIGGKNENDDKDAFDGVNIDDYLDNNDNDDAFDGVNINDYLDKDDKEKVSSVFEEKDDTLDIDIDDFDDISLDEINDLIKEEVNAKLDGKDYNVDKVDTEIAPTEFNLEEIITNENNKEAFIPEDNATDEAISNDINKESVIPEIDTGESIPEETTIEEIADDIPITIDISNTADKRLASIEESIMDEYSSFGPVNLSDTMTSERAHPKIKFDSLEDDSDYIITPETTEPSESIANNSDITEDSDESDFFAKNAFSKNKEKAENLSPRDIQSRINDRIRNIIQAKQDNDALIISERTNCIFLPFTIDELKEYMKYYPDIYKSLVDVVDKEFILSFEYFMNHPVKARFEETYNLLKNRERKNVISSLATAMKLANMDNLNPAIIAACKNEYELNSYLYYLNSNNSRHFKLFNIIYDITLC